MRIKKIKIEVEIEIEAETGEALVDVALKAVKDSVPKIANAALDEIVKQETERALKDGTLARVYGACKLRKRIGSKRIMLTTELGKLYVISPQIETVADGKSHNITRYILGLEPRRHVPPSTAEAIALCAARGTLRAAEDSSQALFGVDLSRDVFRYIYKRYGEQIIFSVNPDWPLVFEADATGVPIIGVDQRKYEIKIISQRAPNGRLCPVWVKLGRKFSGWDEGLNIIANSATAAEKPLLIYDGDKGIHDALLKHKNRIDTQICTFHLPRGLYDALRRDVRQEHAPKDLLLQKKTQQVCADIASGLWWRKAEKTQKYIGWLADFCEEKGYALSAEYLRASVAHIFTCKQLGIYHSTTSKTERIMRTLNARINCGKWSFPGAEAMCKIIISWFYAGEPRNPRPPQRHKRRRKKVTLAY